jgi:hypothetical protein
MILIYLYLTVALEKLTHTGKNTTVYYVSHLQKLKLNLIGRKKDVTQRYRMA